MTFRPALLLCGTVLIVAAPMWAGSIRYSGSTEESSDAGILTTLNAPTKLYSYMLPASVLFDEKGWGKVGDWKKGGDIDKGKDGIVPAAAPVITHVPEPGSFSLLLIGLAATGIVALRRRKLSSAI